MKHVPATVRQRRRSTDPDKDRWRTPDALWSALHERFGFTLDAAAEACNAKCPAWFGPGGLATDALLTSWVPPTPGAAWCNPPFSLKHLFVPKAAEESERHGLVIAMSLPAVTDPPWFHADILGVASELWFFKGRVQYVRAAGEGRSGCAFPSMLAIWDGLAEPGTYIGSLTPDGVPVYPGDRARWAQRLERAA